ncbi:hypothetical protein CR105_10340 [Massilia eurypsychrophila]|uniref:Uncharacterized protein n=1 Tax=Massilia eurypsychrophila TaxID=1485217 RepID=A0A2G8TGE7_9BURK|nr:hypothetical protein CR105_10340 [Massilia eurypsychrophila]
MPLTVEHIITERGKVKLDLSIGYANSDRQGVSAAEPISVQTGPTSFIAIPTQFGESIGNSDTTVTSLGLRYGLTAKAEIYARLSGLMSNQRSSGLGQSVEKNESRFVDAWAGINYQFKDDGYTPALVGFAELALSEKHRSSTSRFKSVMFGATTYKAIDPVVFSLTAAYRYNGSLQEMEQRYEPGNLLLINPCVAFAVNDRVTLSTDVQWTRLSASRLSGNSQGIARTATDLVLGVGYAINRDNTVNTTFKVNASGRGGSELRLNWLYTF